jgi:hydrogenase-4 component B
MVESEVYWFMLLCYSAGVLSAFLTKKSAKVTNYVAHSMALLGSLTAIVCALFVLWQGTFSYSVPMGLPFGPYTVRVDGLSAFFLLVIGMGGSMVSLYAWGYSREYYKQRLPLMAGLYNLFLLSMVLVVTVSQIVAFIIAWEMMSVSSFFLVNHEYDKKMNARAAFIYIVMTHIGTVFVITAFLLLAGQAGSMDFAVLKTATFSPYLKNLVFICALIGFGTKAGIVPLHVWLPRAHPAAPSHVSALMSGIMLKTAIYGFCRIYFDFLGTGPQWWGMVILIIAAVTAVLGALYAFLEHDIKRLLAYSSVENMGIIFLGIGAGMVLMSAHRPTLAMIAWVAAFFHILNHAVFKSLSFMGAGAVLQACHTKDMEQLGGLIKKMPYTAVFSLIGAASISALPPFNGFVSEWLTFQALFLLPHALAGIFGKVFGAVLIALLGLTGALAAACFVEAFGITFLARPRSKKAETAMEVPLPIRAAMGIASLLCIILGIWPQGLLMILRKVFDGVFSTKITEMAAIPWYQLAFAQGEHTAVLSEPVVAGIFLAGLILGYGVYRLYGNERRIAAETWTCGIVPDAHMEYTAYGFSRSIRRVFSTIVHPYYENLVSANANRYHGRRLSYNVRMIYLFSTKLYKPVNERILRLARLMKRIQTGSVQLYVGYIMAVTILLLLCSTRW